MTTYTTHELGELLGLNPYSVRISFLQKADVAGWLKPSVRARQGSGDGAALYDDDDLTVARAVLAVYPLTPVTVARSPSLSRNRFNLASMVRATPDHRWLMLCGKHGRRTNRAESVIAFRDEHPGEVVTLLDLDEFRSEPPMESG